MHTGAEQEERQKENIQDIITFDPDRKMIKVGRDFVARFTTVDVPLRCFSCDTLVRERDLSYVCILGYRAVTKQLGVACSSKCAISIGRTVSSVTRIVHNYSRLSELPGTDDELELMIRLEDKYIEDETSEREKLWRTTDILERELDDNIKRTQLRNI